jgi:hypothetical protein
MYAAYNAITAPKSLTLLLEVGHSYPVEQHDATERWIAELVGLR